MAQSPFTGLLTGSSTPFLASGDVVVFVDVSDTTQSPSGSLVKGTQAQFFAALNVPVNVTSASATAFAVGLTGATNSAFTVDASAALQVAGLKVTGAVTGGTVAIVATDSGAATNISLNAKGSGTVSINATGTGAITLGRATTITTGGLTVSAGGANIRGTSAATSIPLAQVTNGTDAPTGLFTSGSGTFAVVGNNTGLSVKLAVVGDASASTGVRIFGAVCGNTVASPAATGSGQVMVQFGARGYTGSGWVAGDEAGGFNVTAAALWSGTSNPTTVKIFTTAVGSTGSSVAITVGSDQSTTFAGSIVGGATSDITINTNKFTVAASSGNTVIAGTLALTGIGTFTTTAKIATYTALQIDNGGTALSVVNNGTTTITLPNYGTYTISEVAVNGTTAVFVVSNSAITILYQTSTDFSVTAATPAKTNVTYAAGVLTIENKLGSTAGYRVSSIGRGP